MPSWYYEKSELLKTPSVKSGLSLQQERTFRKEGASYIMELGNYLQLHYVTCATACTFFHRFYMFHSFSEYPRYLTATACLFLAGKVEETPKKWKVVWKAATDILKQDQMVGFEGFDHKLLTYERILLQAIQFDLIVEHPHQYITKYAKTLKGSKEKVEKLVQIAWNFANDSLRTTLCLEWEPPIIAISFLQLAGKFNNVDLNAMQGNSSRNWWRAIFDDLSEDLLEDICHQVLDLYNDQKSGSKLKQDVKKKRTSSKLAQSRPSVNGSDSNHVTMSDDPSRKKSRHSKPAVVASTTPTSSKLEPRGTVQTVHPAAVAQQPIYFAAASTSQSGSQTVTVYCQPGTASTANAQAIQASGSAMFQVANPGYNTAGASSSLPMTSFGATTSANAGHASASNQQQQQMVNCGLPNMYYALQMPSNSLSTHSSPVAVSQSSSSVPAFTNQNFAHAPKNAASMMINSAIQPQHPIYHLPPNPSHPQHSIPPFSVQGSSNGSSNNSPQLNNPRSPAAVGTTQLPPPPFTIASSNRNSSQSHPSFGYHPHTPNGLEKMHQHQSFHTPNNQHSSELASTNSSHNSSRYASNNNNNNNYHHHHNRESPLSSGFQSVSNRTPKSPIAANHHHQRQTTHQSHWTRGAAATTNHRSWNN